MIDTANFPSPQTTLVIVLGASEWPHDETFEASKAFEQAASKIKTYFLNNFGLPQNNLLWLFDTSLNERDIDKEICKHLENFGEQTRDVLVYYTGHGRPTDDRSSLYLAIRDTQAHDPESSSLRFKSLARTLKAKARHLRRFYILDCCFAALGQNILQGASVFETLCKKTLEDVEIPLQGYAGLFSSGKEEMSVILPTHENTFFSEAFLQVLLEGSPYQVRSFSLKEIYILVENRLRDLYKNYRSKYPQTLRPPSPQLYAGDVAFLPLFPNPHAEMGQHRKTEGKRRRKTRRHKVTEEGRRGNKTQQYIARPIPPSQLEADGVYNLSSTFESAKEKSRISTSEQADHVSHAFIKDDLQLPSLSDQTASIPKLIKEPDTYNTPGISNQLIGVVKGKNEDVRKFDPGTWEEPGVQLQSPRTIHSAQKSTRQSGHPRRRIRKLQSLPGPSLSTPRPQTQIQNERENRRAFPPKPNRQQVNRLIRQQLLARKRPDSLPDDEIPNLDEEVLVRPDLRSTQQSGHLRPHTEHALQASDYSEEEELWGVPARVVPRKPDVQQRVLPPKVLRSSRTPKVLPRNRRVVESTPVVATSSYKKKVSFQKAVDFIFGKQTRDVLIVQIEQPLYTVLGLVRLLW